MDLRPTQPDGDTETELSLVEDEAPIVLETTDEDLMLAYANNQDHQAFTMLYNKHKYSLYRYCVRMTGNEAVGADLFQETWSKIIKARNHYKVKAKFKTYMFHIAHNLIIDHWRKRKVEFTSIEEQQASGYELAANFDFIADLEKEERVKLFKQALEVLPPQQRDAVLLHYDHGLTLEEIGRLEGTGRETIKSRLRYAKEKLHTNISIALNGPYPDDGEE